MPLPSKESDRSCIYVRDIEFASFYNVLLGFGTVPTVWYISFFILSVVYISIMFLYIVVSFKLIYLFERYTHTYYIIYIYTPMFYFERYTHTYYIIYIHTYVLL
jgi:hypothetical protein